MSRAAALALAAAAVLAVAAGCGDVAEEPGEAGGAPPPATGAPDTGYAETGGTAPATTSTEPSPPAPELRPPAITLASDAGHQRAVQESYCVTGAGVGVCADTFDQDPKRLTVVKPGDEVTISMPGATLTGGDSAFAVRPLGCHGQELATVPLGPDGARWAVDLEPGAYELQVFVHFEAEDGTSGDSSGSLGLLVDPDREPAIVKAKPGLFVCPPSDQG
jgi:hypothetical protein